MSRSLASSPERDGSQHLIIRMATESRAVRCAAYSTNHRALSGRWLHIQAGRSPRPRCHSASAARAEMTVPRSMAMSGIARIDMRVHRGR